MKTEEVIDHIVKWLADYANNAGQAGYVVGVSGGIDSAVTSFLAAKTGLKVMCVEMPIHQNKDQVNRAAKHIAELKTAFSNVESICLDLSDLYNQFKSSMPAGDNVELEDLGLINSRARLRMTTLYHLATMRRSLVAGTGNKIEDFGVGFYTKYGDGGVDLSPIADLTKTEVFAIGKELGVIEEILSAAPTDGLWGDERTDEDQIGASYPELEWAMKEHENGASLNDFSGRHKEVFEIYSRLNTANQHKMQAIPVCMIPLELR